jgi:hypothetical protein
MIDRSELKKLSRGANKYSNTKLFNFIRKESTKTIDAREAKANLKQAAQNYINLHNKFNKE